MGKKRWGIKVGLNHPKVGVLSLIKEQGRHFLNLSLPKQEPEMDMPVRERLTCTYTQVKCDARRSGCLGLHAQTTSQSISSAQVVHNVNLRAP